MLTLAGSCASVPFRGADVLCVGTDRPTHPDDFVSHGEVVNSCSNGDARPCELDPMVGPKVSVGPEDRRGCDANEDLAVGGHRLRDVGNTQDLRAARTDPG
jgi:hypothetical protein